MITYVSGEKLTRSQVLFFFFFSYSREKLSEVFMLTAIDQIANQNHLQIFKAALPYLPREKQKVFSIFVKLLEFQNVTAFFSGQTDALQSCSSCKEEVSFPEILNEIRNFCDEKERGMIDQISNLITTMELFSMMMENEESEDDDE